MSSAAATASVSVSRETFHKLAPFGHRRALPSFSFLKRSMRSLRYLRASRSICSRLRIRTPEGVRSAVEAERAPGAGRPVRGAAPGEQGGQPRISGEPIRPHSFEELATIICGWFPADRV